MKDHDTDNDFLDDLYSHSAKEIPPAVLDKAILKQAFDHVHKDNFFQRLQLQRVFSVAAVLVLSVYIVFDMGEQSMGVDDFLRTEEGIRFASPAFDEESALPIEGQRLKVEKVKINKMMDSSVYESIEDTVEEKGVIVSAEKMIEEIEKLIAADNLMDAKKTYQELSNKYPEYPIPSRIIKALK
jgi:hypothetical protein